MHRGAQRGGRIGAARRHEREVGRHVSVEAAPDVGQQLGQVGIIQREAGEQHGALEGSAQELLVAAVGGGEHLAVLAGEHQRGRFLGRAGQPHDGRVLAIPDRDQSLAVGAEAARRLVRGCRSHQRIAERRGRDRGGLQREEPGQAGIGAALEARVAGQRGAVDFAAQRLELLARGDLRRPVQGADHDGKLAGAGGSAQRSEDAGVDPARLAHGGASSRSPEGGRACLRAHRGGRGERRVKLPVAPIPVNAATACGPGLRGVARL